MGAMTSQITSLTIVFTTVYSDADQRKHQSSASLAFVRGIHRRPVNSPHKWPVTRKMFPFHDVIMYGVLTWKRFPQLLDPVLLLRHDAVSRILANGHWLKGLRQRQIAVVRQGPGLRAGNPPMTGGFPHKGSLTRGFDVLFAVRLNKLSNTQSSCQWFEAPWRSLSTTGTVLLSYQCT